jgi:UDP-glucose 4-epimerase
VERVVVLDSFCTGQRRFLPESPRLAIVECDLRDAAGLRAALAEQRPAAVIHLAALHFIPYCNRHPAEAVAVNIGGTENLLEACRAAPPKRLVIASSAAVYPINDAYNREDATPGPTDIYGLTKWCNEEQLKLYASQAETKCAVARISNVYGPRETNPHIVPEIVHQMLRGESVVRLGNTAPKRDYVHVSDVARAFATLAQRATQRVAIYNVGTGREYSVSELVAKLGQVAGRAIQIETDAAKVRPVDRLFLRSDVGRLREELGFSARFDVAEGLEDLWNWAREYPTLAGLPFSN